MKNKNISPWAWIPTLYFAQGLPYVAVMTISVIMYKNLGISNTDIALYTSWLYLPWVWRANLCATFLGNLVYPTPASKMLHFP